MYITFKILQMLIYLEFVIPFSIVQQVVNLCPTTHYVLAVDGGNNTLLQIIRVSLTNFVLVITINALWKVKGHLQLVIIDIF